MPGMDMEKTLAQPQLRKHREHLSGKAPSNVAEFPNTRGNER
jgi:hypothetical protein